MTITSLNLEAPKKQPRVVRDERCPNCKAPKDRRVETAGFGSASAIHCEACGYEFKDV